MFGLFVEHGPYVVYQNMTGEERFGPTAACVRERAPKRPLTAPLCSPQWD